MGGVGHAQKLALRRFDLDPEHVIPDRSSAPVKKEAAAPEQGDG
jgi:hypothetical protein